MRPDSGIRTRMGPGLWDGSSLTPEAGIVLMRTDMPVPDGMKRMGSGTIWGSQMDACIRTAHPIWKTAGTRLTAREKSTYAGTDHSGWLWDGVHWLYRRPSGAYVTDGWRTIDDASYYFSEGHLATGPFSIGGENYFFDSQGKKASGLTVWKNDFYYVNDDQTFLKNSEKEIGGILYRFDEAGRGSMVSQRPSAPSMNFIPGEDWPYKAVTEIPPENEKTELHRTCDQMADQILSEVVNDAMDQRQKAEAIYNWVRGNIRYSGASATRDWVQEAYQGLRLRRGDCFTYYSVSQLLLSRAGIAGIEVVRSTDDHHYWNLVNIDGSWYHFDATPRRAGGYFFLWTDDQMEQYSRQHGGCFTFDRRLYPATPE